MAGSNWMYIILAFAAGVIASETVRKTLQPMLPFDIPSFYASYPAAIDYPTTRTSLAGAVYERDYGNANELNINHVPI